MTCHLFYTAGMLEEPFRQIEAIMARADKPMVVRQCIADRFALALPESLHEHIDRLVNRRRFSEESRSSRSPSTPGSRSRAHSRTRSESPVHASAPIESLTLATPSSATMSSTPLETVVVESVIGVTEAKRFKSQIFIDFGT